MSKIRLTLSDWLYNAGIAGICNIFDANDVLYHANKNYIEFEENALENFEEKYFKFFIEKYLKFTSWYKIVCFIDYIEAFDEKKVDDKSIKVINDQIEYMKNRLKSNSYKSGYVIIGNDELDLLKEEKKLKKIKKSKKQEKEQLVPVISEQLNIIKNIILYLQRDNAKRIILAKNIIYDIIVKFWSDVSFLNSQKNKKDMYEEFNRDFVESVRSYLSEERKKYKYKCFSCINSIAKLSKPAAYDLTWINKIGVDMSRKTSHFWEFYGDTYICPICNLVYACVPAGFTVLRDRGLFINQNANIRSLINVNRLAIDHNTRFEDLEEESYFAIMENLRQSAIEHGKKEIENIQVIKLDTQNERRPYSFNILSKDKLKILERHRRTLRGLVNAHVLTDKKEYINLYSKVVSKLYNNKNQFDLINQLLKLKLSKNQFNKLWHVKSIIKINNDFLGGIMKGKAVSYKQIDQIQSFGFDLRKAYINKKAENKINSISYKLLNALKTKNTNKFMDTLINAYMYLNKQIPVEFVDGLKDVDRFQTLGYTFMLGFQGEKSQYNEKGEIEEEQK